MNFIQICKFIVSHRYTTKNWIFLNRGVLNKAFRRSSGVMNKLCSINALWWSIFWQDFIFWLSCLVEFRTLLFHYKLNDCYDFYHIGCIFILRAIFDFVSFSCLNLPITYKTIKTLWKNLELASFYWISSEMSFS